MKRNEKMKLFSGIMSKPDTGSDSKKKLEIKCNQKVPEWAYFTLPGYDRAALGGGANDFINVNSIIFGRIISHGEKDFR